MNEHEAEDLPLFYNRSHAFCIIIKQHDEKKNTGNELKVFLVQPLGYKQILWLEGCSSIILLIVVENVFQWIKSDDKQQNIKISRPTISYTIFKFDTIYSYQTRLFTGENSNFINAITFMTCSIDCQETINTRNLQIWKILPGKTC